MLDPNTHDIELMHVWVVRSFKVSIQFEVFFTSKTTNQTKTLYTFKAISVFIALFFLNMYVCS